MFDILIKNGIVADGSGRAMFMSDIGILKDKIVWVGKNDKLEALSTIDAKGLVVAPGFIDLHAHDDSDLLVNPGASPKVLQGITTELIGLCGSSLAPVLPGAGKGDEWKIWMEANQQGGLEWNWESYGDYLDVIEKSGSAINVAGLIGHGAIRASVMGLENRRPSREELEKMKNLIAESLDQGAKGLSIGLFYIPSSFADEKELTELHRVVGEKEALMVPHIRDLSGGIVGAINEVIRIAAASKAMLHISHLNFLGEDSWDKVSEVFEKINQAQHANVDVTFDQHTYTAAGNHLINVLPRWVLEGGKEAMLNRLQDSEMRCTIIEEMNQRSRLNPGEGMAFSFLNFSTWEQLLITHISSEKNRHCEGKTIAEIATQEGVDPAETVVNLVVEEKGSAKITALDVYSMDNIKDVMRRSECMFGTDGIPAGRKTHPRLYGMCARILQRFVREEPVLSLPDAIRRLTSASADRLNLEFRGLLKENYYADITVFNYEEVEDVATYYEPRQHPKGIEYVLVNGQIVVDNGKHTGKVPGRILR